MNAPGKIDGREASDKAKAYFVVIHGTFGVWFFEVESASYEERRKGWSIKCSFLPGMNASDRYHYDVLIDAEDGSVKEVRRLSQTPGS